jgi:hypothetical protein
MERLPKATTRRAGRGDDRACFTPQRAQRALALVRRIVDDIVGEYPRLLECQELLELAQRRGSAEYLNRVQADMLASANKLQGYSDELAALGVQLCDFSRGRVEFPGLWNGREIRLCWQHGEEQIACWYDPRQAHARRPLSELAGAQPAPSGL